MGDKNRYDVKIANNNYVLKTKRSKEETNKIVKYVDMELKSAKDQLKYRNPAMHATLACLNIADTLYNISEDYDKLKEESALPLKEYGPLKARYESLLTRNDNYEGKIKELEVKLKQLEEMYKKAFNDAKVYKDQHDLILQKSQSYDQEVKSLREKLFKQEKETLVAHKQLQEALKKSGA